MRYIITLFILTTALFSSVQWQTDYKEALKLAEKNNKRVYMLIVSSDCQWCNKFENTTLKNAQILQRLEEKYILLHLVRDFDDIPSQYKTSPVPRHYFIDSKGKIVFPIVGYRDVDMFNDFLDNADVRYKRLENEISSNK